METVFSWIHSHSLGDMRNRINNIKYKWAGHLCCNCGMELSIWESAMGTEFCELTKKL